MILRCSAHQGNSVREVAQTMIPRHHPLYALRLHDSAWSIGADKNIAQLRDWRFLNELKRD